MDDEGDPDLRQYLAILGRRKGLVVLVALAVTVVAVVLALLQSPTYQASALVLRKAPPVDPLVQQTGNTPQAQRELNNEIRELESSKARDAVAKVYTGPLRVSTVKGTVVAADADVIRISASAGDPEEVAKLVNTYVDTYLTFRTEQQVAAVLETGDAVRQKADGLSKRMAEMSAPLADLDAKIAALASAPATTNPRTPATATAAQKAELERRRAAKAEELAPQLADLQKQLAFYQQQLDKVEVFADISKAGELRPLESATVPSGPVSPKPLRNGVLGLAMGLLLGVGAAFARDHLDDTLRDKATLEAESELPTLGVIPRLRFKKRGPRQEVVTLSEHTSAAAEAYRTLRTSAKFLSLEDDCRVFQITSASASEGKTLTAMNLAVALTQAGDRTIVVGCDLRRPRLDALAHTHAGPGLTSVLVGDAKLRDAIERHEEIDLSILRTGPIPPDPSELLSSARTKALIKALRGAYDVVILDCPPVLPVSDSLILSAYSDATLLVVSEGETSRRGLGRALELLRQVNAPLRGTVLNGSQGAGGGYGYGYDGYTYAQAPARVNGGRFRRPRRGGDTPAPPPDPGRVLVER